MWGWVGWGEGVLTYLSDQRMMMTFLRLLAQQQQQRKKKRLKEKNNKKKMDRVRSESANLRLFFLVTRQPTYLPLLLPNLSKKFAKMAMARLTR